MMKSYLKGKVRRLQRQGRMPLLTRTAAMLWQQHKLLKDYMNFPAVNAALDRGAFDGDLAASADLVLGGFNGAIRPIQNRDELVEFLHTVQALKPRTVMEIGTAKGGTLLLLCKAASPDATVISLDLQYGRNGGGYPRWKERTFRKFVSPGQTLHLIRGDSHQPSSLAQVERLLDGRKLDLLLIDGDHSYEGVRKDFQMYSPLMSETGVIALHDIVENAYDESIDVHRFWNELEGSRRTVRITRAVHRNMGIGLVLPDETSQPAEATTPHRVAPLP